MNKENILSDKDRKYWENPTEHALMKESDKGQEFFSIYSRVNGKLMMLLDGDLQHAIALGKKMFDNGVRVFDEMNELVEWAKSK